MTELVNLSKYGLTDLDIKDLIGRLDPENYQDIKLIEKLLRLGNDIMRCNNG